MERIKARSGAISRLIVTHIGMAVFGTVLFLWTNQMGKGMTLAVSIFASLFYAAMIYVPMWELGAKDKSAIDAGRLTGYRGDGFWIAAVAQIPVLLLTLVYFVCALVPQTELADSIRAVCYAILILVDGCFTGIMITLAPQGKNFAVVAAVFFVAALYVIAVSGVSYLLGTKEFRLFPKKNDKA